MPDSACRARAIAPGSAASITVAAVAITEVNYELALAKAGALTGQPIDEAKLRQLLDAAEVACTALR